MDCRESWFACVLGFHPCDPLFFNLNDRTDGKAGARIKNKTGMPMFSSRT